MEDKVFRSTTEQIEILRNRKLVITDEEKAKLILCRENYYNLINGYKDVFLKSQDPEEYIDGTTLDELYSLYLFDRELRSIFIKYILIIENNVKSVIAHEFSKQYGHRDYLRTENFRTPSNNESISHRDKSQYIGDVTELIANIHREIAHQLKKNSTMISHYMLDFGYVPLWVLVNTLSLGTISIFYSYLKQKDQNDVARRFDLKPEVLSRFLSVLTIFRNACAHDERLFSLKTVKNGQIKNSLKSVTLHDMLDIPKGAAGHLHGKNDLLAVVIIFKYMLTPQYFEQFFNALEAQINELERALHSIPIENVLKQMGFVDNGWSDWRRIKEIDPKADVEKQ